MEYKYIIILLIIVICIFTMKDSIPQIEEGYVNSTPNDISGCRGCFVRNRAGNLITTDCSKPWQSKEPLKCECKTCYDPQYYNNDIPFRFPGEELIDYNSKVCRCTPCVNTQMYLRPY
jgi:hypothetical protein